MILVMIQTDQESPETCCRMGLVIGNISNGGETASNDNISSKVFVGKIPSTVVAIVVVY